MKKKIDFYFYLLDILNFQNLIIWAGAAIRIPGYFLIKT